MKRIVGWAKPSFRNFICSLVSLLLIVYLGPTTIEIDASTAVIPPQPSLSIPAWIPTSAPQAPIQQSPPMISTALVTPDENAVVSSASGNISLSIPKGAVDSTVEIQITEFGTEYSPGMKMVSLFELTATMKDSEKRVSQFNKSIQITFKHSIGDFQGIDTSLLRLYCLDEKTLQWQPLS
ncbi:hypothetical protein ABFB09_07490 [Dehalogenimonas sp. THU2]|uniref:hypothetical protein n=1 Tax=Dehalogenimonas sp. THU2 TaxID=3151121 RepID=UPI003218D825